MKMKMKMKMVYVGETDLDKNLVKYAEYSVYSKLTDHECNCFTSSSTVILGMSLSLFISLEELRIQKLNEIFGDDI